MSCKCAKPTDQYHGWECEVSGGECVYLMPNSRACAKKWGEGPDVDFDTPCGAKFIERHLDCIDCDHFDFCKKKAEGQAHD